MLDGSADFAAKVAGIGVVRRGGTPTPTVIMFWVVRAGREKGGREERNGSAGFTVGYWILNSHDGWISIRSILAMPEGGMQYDSYSAPELKFLGNCSFELGVFQAGD